MTLSKYVHAIQVEKNIYCLYNSLTSKKAYLNISGGNKKLEFFDHQTVQLLKKHRFFVQDYRHEQRLIDFLKKERHHDLSQLYLIVSEVCNFRCEYCRQYCHGSHQGSSIMSFATAKQMIDYFFRQATRPQGVVFYGGEPMVSPDVILKCVEYIKLKYKNKINKNFDFTLITNGTLVNDKWAKALAKHGVYIIISLDGPGPIHNYFRKYADGNGTFTDVLRGYKIYKRNKCLVGISCTIGQHNYNKLDRTLTYIKNQLKPINIGMNLPHGDDVNALIKGADKNHLARIIAQKLLYYNSHGLYIEHIMRKLNLVFKEEIKINDCPACGGRIVALPDKRVGVCEGAIGMDSFFDLEFSTNHFKRNIRKKWFLTSPLFNNKCRSCLALGICGGGCPLDGFLKKGKLDGRDVIRCVLMEDIVSWGLKSFYQFSLRQRFINKRFNIFIPSISMQDKFLSAMGAKKEKLPLRSSAKYGINKLSL